MCILKKCNGDVVKEAGKVFAKLKMHETKLRNGILFYLAIESRVFSIYGDQGINEKVPSDFGMKLLVQWKLILENQHLQKV